MSFFPILSSTNGSRSSTGRFRRLPMLLLLAMSVLPLLTSRASGQSANPPEEAPDPAFLEFLGSFEDKDTGWVDPFQLETDENGKVLPEEEGDD